MDKLQNVVSHIGIISDIIVEPYFSSLMKLYFGESVKIYQIPYEEYNNYEYQKQLKSMDMVVVWMNSELLYSHICNTMYVQSVSEQQIIKAAAFYEELYITLSCYTNAIILGFLFEDYFNKLSGVLGHPYNAWIDGVNAEIIKNKKDNMVFIDLKALIAEVGIANAYNLKNKYRWNAPYSKELVEVAVREIYKQHLINKGITKKCLVLDCDNVLWGGILSEDGIENIKLNDIGLGRVYRDFQYFILSLYHQGVILSICSKNDLLDVLTVFRTHSGMLLKEEQIACFQVNWEDKPGNIKKISEKLNISLDSMVFVDDSFVEVEAVKAMLPTVTTILFQKDTWYKHFSCFNLRNNIDSANVKARNESYRTNKLREEMEGKCTNYDDYIKELRVEMDIHEALPVEYVRISELTQRTNKCTNGKRYTVAELKCHIISDKVKLYSVSVSDRFSNLGLVGAVEVDGMALTLFSLSCRALGRGVEERILEYIARRHQISRIEFKLTEKNETIKNLLVQFFPSAVIDMH